MMKIFITLIASFIAFLTGCSTSQASGSESLIKSELGVLEDAPDKSDCVKIYGIDGMPPRIGSKRSYELTPGEHSVTAASLCYNYYFEPITRWLDVRAGGEYKFQTEFDTTTKKLDIAVLDKITGKRIDYTHPRASQINDATQYYEKGLRAVQNKYDVQAIEYFSKAIEIDNNCQKAYAERGFIFGINGQYEQSLSDLNKSIELNPSDDLTFNNRGRLYIALKQYDKALIDLHRAIELNPKLYLAYINIARIYSSKGNIDLAITNISKAIEINPSYLDGYIMRGIHYAAEKKEYDKALSDFSKAIEIDPTFAAAYNLKSSILASCPQKKYRNGKEALKLAQKSVEIQSNCISFRLLAASYAELGDFKQAVSAQEESIRLLDSKNCTYKNKTIYLEQLELYKKGIPWRDR